MQVHQLPQCSGTPAGVPALSEAADGYLQTCVGLAKLRGFTDEASVLSDTVMTKKTSWLPMLKTCFALRAGTRR